MSRKNSELLLRTLQNPTKVKVIVLLTDRESMTVTQMAGIVKVSRANLYHFVSEMVDEGLLLGPESKVKGNYVEKYYRLNEKVFEGEEEDWQEAVKAAKPEVVRDLLCSLLVSVSMQFRIMSEQLTAADERTLAKLAKARDQHAMIVSYGVLPDDEYVSVVKDIRNVMTAYDKRPKRKPTERGRNKVVIFAIPELSSERFRADR
jgi:DNA-binding transcriptional ArsR family regulator